MADILNISESHYRKIESKYSGITADKLMQISAFFEMSVEQFLNNEENAIIKFIHAKDEQYVNRIKRKFKSPPPEKKVRLKKHSTS